MNRTLGLVAAAAALALNASCGGSVTSNDNSDGGSDGASGLTDGTTDAGPDVVTDSSAAVDTGLLDTDGSDATTPDGGPDADADVHADADNDAAALTYIDAGYYHGDGSFFVDGGAYADAGMQSDASNGDAGEIDASPGCASLAACCPSLQGSSLGLCDDIVAQGNTADCQAELSQLEAAGNCSGVTILASQVQVPPNWLVSDGSLLFWTTASTPGLLAMPVGGGAVTVLLDGPITNPLRSVNSPNGFLAVDGANVYILKGNAIVRIPKDGSPASLVNDPGGLVLAVTLLGPNAYWMEYDGNNYGFPTMPVAVKTAPLLGGPVSQLASFQFANPGVLVGVDIGVTSSSVFVGARAESLSWFSMGSGMAPAPVSAGAGCNLLTSDRNDIYCAQDSASNLSLASDGSSTTLGAAVTSSYVVFDDTYVYWADEATVGTIIKAPKAGGGSATVLARDTSPTAIAVDSNSVYWSDQGGYIKSITK